MSVGKHGDIMDRLIKIDYESHWQNTLGNKRNILEINKSYYMVWSLACTLRICKFSEVEKYRVHLNNFLAF